MVITIVITINSSLFTSCADFLVNVFLIKYTQKKISVFFFHLGKNMVSKQAL